MGSPAHTAHTVVGVIGNVISAALFLSPIPTFWRIIKKRDVEEFQPYPYVATVLNCALWVFYGLPVVIKDGVLVVTINGFGFVIQLIYIFIYCIFDRENKKRTKVLLYLGLEVIFMAVVILISMLVIHDHSKRAVVVGVLCDILNVCMYGSPLLIWKQVIRTKSVEFMPFYLSLANFSNGVCWTLYAMLELDYFILISNGLGALMGALQLIIYVYYGYIYKHPADSKPGDGDIVKPSEIQLSTA